MLNHAGLMFADHILARCADGSLYHVTNRYGRSELPPKGAVVVEYELIFPGGRRLFHPVTNTYVPVTASTTGDFAEAGPKKVIGRARQVESPRPNELWVEAEIDDPIAARALVAKLGPPSDVLRRKKGYSDGMKGLPQSQTNTAYMCGYRRGRANAKLNTKRKSKKGK